MAVGRHQPHDAGRAEPVRQTVEQRRSSRLHGGPIRAAEPHLAFGKRLDVSAGEGHRVNAEAGVDRGELLAHQRHQVRRAATGTARAQAQVMRGAVGAVETQHEACAAFGARLEQPGEIGGEHFRQCGHAIRRDERLGERAGDGMLRRLRQRDQRLGRPAQRAVEAGEHTTGDQQRLTLAPCCRGATAFTPRIGIGTEALRKHLARQRLRAGRYA